jgi:hypothetical protein
VCAALCAGHRAKSAAVAVGDTLNTAAIASPSIRLIKSDPKIAQLLVLICLSPRSFWLRI